MYMFDIFIITLIASLAIAYLFDSFDDTNGAM
jgi:hypothetical protein